MSLRAWIVGSGACALAAGAACYRTRTIAKQDWPVVPDSQLVRVRTVSGTEYELRKVAFTTDGLIGVRQLKTTPAAADTLRIPLDSIDVVRVRQLDKVATAWLVAASATATFVLIAQSQGDERPVAVPEPPPVSCPFIYSFDGQDYVFDSETYAGAVSRALERTDVDNLERLRLSRGRYRLQLRNERDETEYTDQLALEVVDHPAGTRAFPDAAGAVHLVGAGTAPVSTRGYAGDSLPARAGWELAFPKPAGVDRLALVVRARNSSAAPIVLRTVLDLLGQDVYAWYARLQRDALTRAQLAGWMLREGGLAVDVQRGSAWTRAALLPDVGPAIPKSLVIPIDAAGLAGDTVRVRLESSPLLWFLESAELAPYAGRAEMLALAPATAVDDARRDVVRQLSSRDSAYFVGVKGSRVSLEFIPPPVRAGASRTVFARTTGHYYFPTRDETPSRADLVVRIMSDRAFGQRYLMDALSAAGHR